MSFSTFADQKLDPFWCICQWHLDREMPRALDHKRLSSTEMAPSSENQVQATDTTAWYHWSMPAAFKFAPSTASPDCAPPNAWSLLWRVWLKAEANFSSLSHIQRVAFGSLDWSTEAPDSLLEAPRRPHERFEVGTINDGNLTRKMLAMQRCQAAGWLWRPFRSAPVLVLCPFYPFCLTVGQFAWQNMQRFSGWGKQ